MGNKRYTYWWVEQQTTNKRSAVEDVDEMFGAAMGIRLAVLTGGMLLLPLGQRTAEHAPGVNDLTPPSSELARH